MDPARARPPRQLLTYWFGPDGHFEGQLLGALERLEAGGTIRICEILFLAHEARSGALSVINISGDGAGKVIAPLLEFRLDSDERRRATERALDPAASAWAPGVLERLGASLPPGGALTAVLVEHRWQEVLDQAAAQTGGVAVMNDFVGATALADLSDELLAVASNPDRIS